MPQISQALEFNTFVGGLVTEASPLTFPDNSSLDEDNFVLDKNGSRRRRLGMDLQSGGSIQETSQTAPIEGDMTFNYFQWENAGGVADKTVGVVQVGSRLDFYDLDGEYFTSRKLGSHVVPQDDGKQLYSFASVDGLLVVATGKKDLLLGTLNGSSVDFSNFSLKIRDQFGVDAIVDGVNLNEGNDITVRPKTLTPQHRYNLQNQTWGEPRAEATGLWGKVDCITYAKSQLGYYPSNSDDLNLNLFSNTAVVGDPITPRFWTSHFSVNPMGNTPAPKGFFIIDALERGASRIEEQNSLVDRYSELVEKVGNLPQDKTPGGATVVAQFGGRIWYSGFSGEVIGGDTRSPRLSSYVLFSKLVKDPSDLNVCYQTGDPTSTVAPDILDTDGGFVKLDGAYNIQAMYDTGNSLVVLAENGVWTVSGGTDTGFSATAYIVRKVSDHGTISPSSVIIVDNGLMYWSDDGIYHLAADNYGDMQASNISFNKIQSLYNSISDEDKSTAQGTYDNYERRAKWVYQNRLGSIKEVKELVLDVSLGAYYKNSIKGDGSGYPKVIAPVEVPPYFVGSVTENVLAGADQVLAGADEVQVDLSVRQGGSREVVYLVVTRESPTVQYGIATYSDLSFKDWTSVTGGTDYSSYLLTGYISGNEHQKYKGIGYLTTHFLKTESGFELGESGDLEPTSPSGCLVQSQWDWTNSVASGKWSKKFQAYRPRRHYIPMSVGDDYDTGHETVVTKSKLRGRGRVVSILFESEEGKDLQLLGWGMTIGVNNNV